VGFYHVIQEPEIALSRHGEAIARCGEALFAWSLDFLELARFLIRFTLAMASWLAMSLLWCAMGFPKLVLSVTPRCELASSSLWQGLDL